MTTLADTTIRSAVPTDNAGLVALAAACPMRAAVSLCVHRGPDFFALSRLQGDPWHLLVADAPGVGIVACLGVAERLLWLDGRPTRVMYAGDFKVHPSVRGQGFGDRLLREGWALCATAGLPVLLGALAGNAPIERRVAASPTGLPRLRTLGTVRVSTLLLPGLPLARPPRGLHVRPAGPDDLAAMMTLWQRVAPLRQAAPVLDADGFTRFLAEAPGLSLADYLVAERHGSLAGFLGVWDQDSFKETRVLGYGAPVALARRAHDLLARPLGWPRLPVPGEPLRALHVVHPCVPADRAEVFGALLGAARRRCTREGVPVLELGLDPGDPLERALGPVPRLGADVRLYLSPGAGDEGGPPGPRPGDGPLHFETALV